MVLNHNQNLLGKTMLVLRRHEEVVAALTQGEWTDLHRHLRRVVRALDATFALDHDNHVFLQNLDRHVHLHVIPRYAAERTWQGLTFRDLDWPDHYGVPGRNPKPISTADQRAERPRPIWRSATDREDPLSRLSWSALGYAIS